MSVNSQKQTYKQFTEWLEWFNRKYNRLGKNTLDLGKNTNNATTTIQYRFKSNNPCGM